MASNDGKTESVGGSSSSDLISESYAFLALRACEMRAQGSLPVSERSTDLISRSYKDTLIDA
jgi:hypothetical protein